MRSPLGTLLNRTPVPYVGRGSRWTMPGLGGRNDPTAQLRSMGSVGTLFSIVNRTSNATSQVAWHLYRKAASGKDEDRVEVTSHAALDLWLKPNKFMPGQEFVESFQQHLDLTGEAWWIIARNPLAKLPLELWPVRPDRMAPVPDRRNFLSGYIYTGPDGEEIPLKVDEVIFLRMPNPEDPYRGMGPVQAILTDLDATKFSAEWNRNFFMNSSEPGGIIEVDRRLSDDEFDELTARWGEQHRGVSRAHRVAVIEAGMKWVDRAFSQRDMQFAELRSISSAVIREAFGMPKFAVGDVDDVNRATADASAAWFAQYLTVPRLERIKGALNFELLPLYGPSTKDLEFDYDDPVPANQEAANAQLTARSTAAKTLVDAGWEPDGVLEVVGLPEIEFIGKPEPPAAPVAEEPPVEPTEPPAPSRRGAVALLNAADREDWEDRLDDLLAEWADVVAPAQFDELVEQIEKIVSAGAPADLASLSVSTDRAAELLGDAMIDQATAAGQRVAKEAAEQGVSIAPATPTATLRNAKPRLPKFVEGLAADLRAGAKVTAGFLGSAIAGSAAKEALRSWAPAAKAADVAAAVRSHLEGLTDSTLRAELGGSIWAAENEGRFATFELAEAAGYGASEYEADETRDANSCGPCLAVDGTRYATIAEAQAAYPFGGYTKCEGRSRCRGSIRPIWK